MTRSRPVVFVALATAFSLLGDQALYAILPTCYTELGLVPYQVGLLLSVNRWIRLLTNQLAAHICRQYRLGLLLGLSFGLGAILTAVYGLSSSFAILFLARLLWGVCWSFIRQIGLMTVVDSATRGRAGQLMGVYHGISRLGAITGNLVGALGYDLVGFTAILLIFAGFSLFAVPLGGLSRRSLARAEGGNEEETRDRNPGVGLLFAGFAAGCVGVGGIMSTLGLVLKEEVGDVFTVGGIHIGVATLTGALLASRWGADLAAPMVGGLTDRIGRRWAGPFFFAFGAMVLFAVAALPGPLPLIFGIPVFFVGATGATMALVAEAGVRGPRAVAWYVTAADLGSASGPVLGWMVPQWGLPAELIFAIGGGLYALAGLVVLGALGE